MKRGFTLIETLVVVSVLGIIMTTVVSIMLNTFKAKGRNDVTNRLEKSGNYLQMSLRRNILNSIGSKIICPTSGVGSSMVLVNKVDGQPSIIECLEVESKIASVSAGSGSINLSGTDVGVLGCNTFISCSTLPSTGEVGTVNLSFYLYSSSGGSAPESYVKRLFENKVVVRNY